MYCFVRVTVFINLIEVYASLHAPLPVVYSCHPQNRLNATVDSEVRVGAGGPGNMKN